MIFDFLMIFHTVFRPVLSIEILTFVYRRLAVKYSPKVPKRWCFEFFLHIFTFFSHILPNTCSIVMILHPEHNQIFLNMFLTLLWCQNRFTLSHRQEIKINHQKIAKNTLKKFDCGRIFYDEFYLLTLRERKNDFNIEKILETCS